MSRGVPGCTGADGSIVMLAAVVTVVIPEPVEPEEAIRLLVVED